MKKAALFDMDGTLVDNSPVHIRAFELFCARYGVSDWKEKLADSFGMGNDDIMRAVMPEEIIREKGIAALADEKEAIYREIYAPDIHPVEGLVELLERLRAAGVRCAVGTSGPKANMDFVLEKCAIGPYFDAKVSGDMVTRCKPDPEIYLTAAAGWMRERRGRQGGVLSVPYYFLFMNLNVFRGAWYLITHRGRGAWEKARRA